GNRVLLGCRVGTGGAVEEDAQPIEPRDDQCAQPAARAQAPYCWGAEERRQPRRNSGGVSAWRCLLRRPRRRRSVSQRSRGLRAAGWQVTGGQEGREAQEGQEGREGQEGKGPTW